MKESINKHLGQTPSVAFSYAPGKLILAGEHAVVYGAPAIAMTLDRGVRVGVAPRTIAQKGPVLRTVGFGGVVQVCGDEAGEGPEVLKQGLKRLVELCGERVRNLEFVADCEIPIGSGLGSSAALSVALVRGVCRYFNESITSAQLISNAMELEKVFHGSPSGVDHTAVACGGCLWYQREERQSKWNRIHCQRPLRFAVGISGQRRGTLQVVLALQERMKRDRAIYQNTFDGIQKVTEEMRLALEKGCLARVGELMDINQGLLNALGVSSAELENLCFLARKNGALGAKLTGAGMGGAVIALVDGDPTPILRVFEASGFIAFKAECGCLEV